MDCNVKWVRIPQEEYNNYDINIKKCFKCKSLIYPYMLHKNICSADYTCYLCGNDICIKFFCKYCKF